MTIFDAIRYPVSVMMTMDDFLAIPRKMRNKWVKHPLFRNNFSLDEESSKELEEHNTNLLRKIIAEWEE